MKDLGPTYVRYEYSTGLVLSTVPSFSSESALLHLLHKTADTYVQYLLTTVLYALYDYFLKFLYWRNMATHFCGSMPVLPSTS